MVCVFIRNSPFPPSFQFLYRYVSSFCFLNSLIYLFLSLSLSLSLCVLCVCVWVFVRVGRGLNTWLII